MVEILAAAASAVPPDKSWFYSSLAQSVATIVGLAGTFLLFHLTQLIARWRDASVSLEHAQDEWIRTELELTSTPLIGGEAELAKALLLQEDHARHGRALRVAHVSVERAARQGWEVTITLAVIIGLFVGGVVVPLGALDAPRDGVKAPYLWGISIVLVLAGVAMQGFLSVERRRLSKIEIDPRVQAFLGSAHSSPETSVEDPEP